MAVIRETVILRCQSCGRALRDEDYNKVGHCPCGSRRYFAARINWRKHPFLISLVNRDRLCEFVNDRESL